MAEQETISPFAAEKVKLRRQLESLDQRRQAVISALEGVDEAERRVLAVESVASGSVASVRPVAPQDSRDLAGKRYQTISKMLRDFGRPMGVPEMAREMMRRGDPNGMDSLRDIIYAICRRKPDLFEKIKRDGQVLWRLRDAPPQEASHDGGKETMHVGDANRNGHAAHAPNEGRHPVVGDLTGKTIAGAAQIVLRDHQNTPMHFSTLAAEMKRRGYRSGRSAELPPGSVATVLNAHRDEFENMGGGKFRLIET